jgi:hypothetical protein
MPRRKPTLTFNPGPTLAEARKEANAKLGEGSRRVRVWPVNALKAIGEEYFEREGDKLRSAEWRTVTFERLIYPALGARQVDTIKR